MTALSPCNVCPPQLQQGCPVREVWREKIKGLGLTTARFRCARRSEAFRPGRRVLALITGGTFVDRGSYDPDYRYSDTSVKGTIIGPASKRGRVLVWLDKEALADLNGLRNENGLCAMPGQKLVFLDEPDQPERVVELEAMDAAQLERAFA